MSDEFGELLVVDDNEMNRDMLSRRLERKGYAVALASDGAQALALVGRQRFDLVLLDVMMPGLNGIEVLQALRKQHTLTELPIIIITARDQGEDVVEALNHGANDYLTKPLDMQVVLARVKTHLSLKRQVERISRLEQTLQERNEQLESANERLQDTLRQLEAAGQRLTADLEAAARLQEALLPLSLPEFPSIRFAWSLRACRELAGNLLNVVPLDDQQIALYLVDVSQQGVSAALLAVMVHRTIAQLLAPPLPGQPLSNLGLAPARLLAHLGRYLAPEMQPEQSFACTYGVLNHHTGEFRFACAGHPGVVRQAADGAPALSGAAGQPIGRGSGELKESLLRLQPGDRLFLYTDGWMNARNAADEVFGLPRLLEAIAAGRDVSLDESLEVVQRRLEAWRGQPGFEDDLAALATELTALAHSGEGWSTGALQRSSGVAVTTALSHESTAAVGREPKFSLTHSAAIPPGLPPAEEPETPPEQEFMPLLSPPLAAGELGWLGPYRVLRHLGTGGMGIVFHAEDSQLQRPVALKVMRPGFSGDAAARQRFLREARAAAALSHDHIVTIYQVGQEKGLPYLAMQFLHGESLDSRLGRTRVLPLAEVLRIARELTDGLAAAHDSGLVHRDIKPGNIWLEASRDRVKILDFGLVRPIGSDVRITSSGLIVGTPTYMAPEQASSQTVDSRADLFSLGCLIYEMATGELPFSGENYLAVLTALATQEPTPMRCHDPQLPVELEELVGQLLAKDPERRPASAAQVMERIRDIERMLASRQSS